MPKQADYQKKTVESSKFNLLVNSKEWYDMARI